MLSRYSGAQGSVNIYARQWTETMDLSVRIEAAVSDALIKNPLNESHGEVVQRIAPWFKPKRSTYQRGGYRG